MKPFWQQVAIAAVPGGFAIRLDGKPVRTPGGQLISPGVDLAEALAEEWRQAGRRAGMTPDDLPLTRLTTTARERIPGARDDIVGQLAAYGANDLLCYRAASPPSLAARQQQLWQPWLDWALAEYGAALTVVTGVLPVNQPAGTSETFAAVLRILDDYALAALGVAVPAMGSLVLGLALAAGALDATAAFETALLEELSQAERWGGDAAAEHRRARIRDDLLLCEKFLRLTGGLHDPGLC